MQVMSQRCAGLDVHLRFLVVCLSIIEAGQRRKEMRTFRKETADLLALRAWLLQEGCTHVAMESTGGYWLPVYRRLEGFFALVVANAQQIKAVAGRKTDVQDAEWIADLLQHGLLSASFVPSQEQHDLRDLTRRRVSLVQERARLVKRVHKVLAEAGIKLSTVLSDVLGWSGRAMLDALCVGESDPLRLVRLVPPKVHATEEQLVAALTAEVRAHHRFLLRALLALIDAHDRSLKHLEQETLRHLHPFEAKVKRCEQIDFSASTRLARLEGRGRNRPLALPGWRTPQLVGRGVSWTQGKCRQAAQWKKSARQPRGEGGAGASGSWGSPEAHLPGRALPSPQETAGE